MQVISIKRHPIIHNQQKFMVISKQLLLLQRGTFCHLIFMQNATEGLPPIERAQVESRLQLAVDFPLDSYILCSPQLGSNYKLLRQNMAT